MPLRTANGRLEPDALSGRHAWLLGLWLALWPMCAAAAPEDLDRLMTVLAQRQHGHVTFVERQYLAVLDRPLESSGELFYDAPDRLEKRTLKPRAETLVFERGTLSVERGHRKHVLDVSRYPQLLPFIESIRGTLAGDRRALEELFYVVLAGTLDRWTLRLRPKDAALTSLVQEIVIEGEAADIRTVEIRQPDGDRSVMTLGSDPAP